VLNSPLQFQSALAHAATHSSQGLLDHDVPPDSQSSLREAFELLGWAAPAPRAFAFAAACCDATLEGMAPSSVHLGYDGPSVTSELPQRLGRLFMRDRGRSASFVSRSSCRGRGRSTRVAALGVLSGLLSCWYMIGLREISWHTLRQHVYS
jgi:hypothetical protein